MAGKNPKNRCPSCNKEVLDEHADALECDAVSPTQPSHWWHRECLEASHLLGGKPVPIYAGLVQFLHGKTYMFRCHMCDRNKAPLPVQLFEQKIINKEQLVQYGAYTKEVRQYLKDHNLEERPPKKKPEEPTVPLVPAPVSLPQATPVTTAPSTAVTSSATQPPPVSTTDPPSIPKVPDSEVPAVPPPVSEVPTSSSGVSDTHVAASSALVAPEKPNDLAITEVDCQHNILFGTEEYLCSYEGVELPLPDYFFHLTTLDEETAKRIRRYAQEFKIKTEKWVVMASDKPQGKNNLYGYGHIINHSPHESCCNVYDKAKKFTVRRGKPVFKVVHYASRPIPAGDQLLRNYGDEYEGVDELLCPKCT